MNLLVFEDAGVRNLSPITLSRPAFAISCASYRLIDLLPECQGNLVGLVRPYLERIQINDYPQLALELDSSEPMTMLINARTVPTMNNLRALQELIQTASPLSTTIKFIRTGWAIAAAVLPTSFLQGQDRAHWLDRIESLANEPNAESIDSDLSLFDYPHDVIAQNLTSFDTNLAYRIETEFEKGSRYTEIHPNVFVGKDVCIDDSVVFDASQGPVVIEDGARIGPFSFFRGPVYVGPSSKISEHASIKDCVSVSHTCKIGGEVEGTIMEPYTNKQHHGFLGHSYLGSWINLGAGTCNSDLKNTYGIVNMEYHGQKVSTGSQFVGCVVGDYAKTAINTSIFTGKTIGVASMIYGFATTNVPSFVNYARTFNEYGCLPPEVIVTTQKRMFERRNVEQRPCDIQLIHDIYQMTQDERSDDLSVEPLSL